jgi:hypothetical protein
MDITPKDILETIDIEKVIKNEGKRKRGRPLKYSQIYTNQNNTQQKVNMDNAEIIAHLKISTAEINAIENNEYDKYKLLNTEKSTHVNTTTFFTENNSGSDSDDDEKYSDHENEEENKKMASLFIQNSNSVDDLKKQLKKEKEENKKQKEFIKKNSQMYQFTITKYNINVNDENLKPIKLTPSNVKCRYCCCNFKTCPVFLPIKKIGNIFIKMGGGLTFSFCSFNCCVTFNISLNDGEQQQRMTLIKHYYIELFKNNLSNFENINIPIRPPLEMHVDFGGILSDQEWREKSIIIGTEYITSTSIQFIPQIHTIEEITNNENLCASYFINNDPSSSKNKKKHL